MEKWFKAAIAAYRDRAATDFHERQSVKHDELTAATHASSIETDSITCYKRVLFPALEDFLRHAAEAYGVSKQRASSSIKKKTAAQKLGSGEPVEALFACVRRERWLTAAATAAHLTRASPTVSFVTTVFCGIPADIRDQAHARYIELRSSIRQQAIEPVVHFGHALGAYTDTTNGSDILSAVVTKEEGYVVHVSRCRNNYAQGRTSLVWMNTPNLENRYDTFEEVKSRYAGKPDELYRRKTARKFARWRRKRREGEQEKLAVELKAEKEMKRRRGYDQRLTSREARDSSFAPFLFETNCQAYAYSTKITEAPKLRKVMIQKYNDSDEAKQHVPDQWERALQAAKSTPLFHTRVMNRFS
ncbi:hypothetical protein BWQ96_00054 [Gracilariopsis chorda]|uniref:Uncharacterized protein n=1 Tax=Gracilariopsis chorda TaxID=448386 RepID=A0A2V3J694_9FLOR|nr:hypothetical protein BWQ96_00054 [Gracilariopsis chorda]|eukprot:PXF49894.1 hypothetical protein BWQ96_00054 [Gracilariopsis chorda]